MSIILHILFILCLIQLFNNYNDTLGPLGEPSSITSNGVTDRAAEDRGAADGVLGIGPVYFLAE
jgi:hypothetical protein